MDRPTEQVFENIHQLDAALLRGDITLEDHVFLARAQAVRVRYGLSPTVVLEEAHDAKERPTV
jgi:hypothetical protein